MNRLPLIVGNWKMELSHKASIETAAALKKLMRNEMSNVEIVICPSFPSLPAVSEILKTAQKIQIGAQNVHWEEKGAWTGEVSVLQIKPFVSWCIVGHSERRENFKETDEMAVQKMQVLLKHGIRAIVCLGETAEEYARDFAVERVTRQARAIFTSLTILAMRHVIIAYEPIWAISTKHNLPDPDWAVEIMLLIRKLAVEYYGDEASERLRIIYGGSVQPENIDQFSSAPGIDGVLVGGASVRPLHLIDIIRRYGTETA